ncbi:hypothetical protein F5X96DRAFT_655019 [Biscogniauxia mediterranea]|nr:hypothetical protein F5X96DRAFT_655019 [Biscogniauxia mediterranea]
MVLSSFCSVVLYGPRRVLLFFLSLTLPQLYSPLGRFVTTLGLANSAHNHLKLFRPRTLSKSLLPNHTHQHSTVSPSRCRVAGMT